VPSVILVSRNPDLTHEVVDGLAGRYSVITCSALNEVRNQLSAAEPPCRGILLDTSGGPGWEKGLIDLKVSGIPVLAILKNASERQAAFLAGADDYLLRPLLSQELIAKLNHATRLHELNGEHEPPRLDPEQQASLGLLSAHILREVDTSLTAAQRAVALARREPDLSEDLDISLTLAEGETRRAAALVRKMRRMTDLEPTPPASFPFEAMLLESVELVLEELKKNNIQLVEVSGNELHSVRGSLESIQMAVLSVLLGVCESLGNPNGGRLKLGVSVADGFVRLQIFAENRSLVDDMGQALPSGTEDLFKEPASLSLARRIIVEQGGSFEASQEGRELSVRIALPADQPGS